MKCNHFTKLFTITSKNKIFMSTSSSFLSMPFQIFILFLAESNFALIIVKNNFTIHENFLLPEALYFRSWQGRKARSLSFTAPKSTCQRLMEETKPKVTGETGKHVQKAQLVQAICWRANTLMIAKKRKQMDVAT